MKNGRRSVKKNRLAIIAAAVLCAAAAVFAFAMTGHRFFAALLLGIALVIVYFHYVKSRAWRAVAAAVLVIGAVAFGVIESPIIADARTDAPEDTEYILVLGAGLNGDVPSLSLTNRLTAALDWLESHPECTAIVSGGQGPGENMTEAEAMGIWLEARGIAPERIILEPEATSTYENLANSFEIIRERGSEPDGNCAIVTSEYHLHRARMMAADQGVEAYGVAARTSMPTLMLNYFIREAFAVTYYRIFGA